jgi:hypothetical protein
MDDVVAAAELRVLAGGGLCAAFEVDAFRLRLTIGTTAVLLSKII